MGIYTEFEWNSIFFTIIALITNFGGSYIENMINMPIFYFEEILLGQKMVKKRHSKTCFTFVVQKHRDKQKTNNSIWYINIWNFLHVKRKLQYLNIFENGLIHLPPIEIRSWYYIPGRVDSSNQQSQPDRYHHSIVQMVD